MSDGVNIEELDYLTRQFYLGHDPDESEQAILDSIANEFINEDTPWTISDIRLLLEEKLSRRKP